MGRGPLLSPKQVPVSNGTPEWREEFKTGLEPGQGGHKAGWAQQSKDMGWHVAGTGWARASRSYLGTIGELVLQPVEQGKVGLGERPGGWGGPGQVELLAPPLHGQLLRWVRPHCGQSGAQHRAALPSPGTEPSRRDPSARRNPLGPRCRWSELTDVTDVEVEGEIEVGGLREPLQVQLQRAQLLGEGAEGGVCEAGAELAMVASCQHPLPQGAIAAGRRQA